MVQAANALEALFIEAVEDENLRPEFYAQLYTSDVFVIPQNEVEINNNAVAPGTQLQLFALADGEDMYVVFFTSQERIAEELGEGTNFLAMKGADFFRLTQGSMLIMNPNCPIGKPFMPDEVDEIIRNNAA